MRFEVHLPVRHDEVATCIIAGAHGRAYIKVRVNGVYAALGPDQRPDDTDHERSLSISPSGGGHDVWSKPMWQAGDILSFELYDEHRQLLRTTSEILVLP
jgi:hypothetical protein